MNLESSKQNNVCEQKESLIGKSIALRSGYYGTIKSYDAVYDKYTVSIDKELHGDVFLSTLYNRCEFEIIE